MDVCPTAIGELAQLQTLDLSENQLTSLPEALGQLSQLQYLDLAGNRLTALPKSLRQLRKLEGLYLHDNPALGLPPEVLGPTFKQVVTDKLKPANPTGILDHYFRLHGDNGSH
ncbi:MAG: leucine-rich repeat domain-containing protein [Verrucomicrobiota bacterium]